MVEDASLRVRCALCVPMNARQEKESAWDKEQSFLKREREALQRAVAAEAEAAHLREKWERESELHEDAVSKKAAAEAERDRLSKALMELLDDIEAATTKARATVLAGNGK